MKAVTTKGAMRMRKGEREEKLEKRRKKREESKPKRTDSNANSAEKCSHQTLKFTDISKMSITQKKAKERNSTKTKNSEFTLIIRNKPQN